MRMFDKYSAEYKSFKLWMNLEGWAIVVGGVIMLAIVGILFCHAYKIFFN